MPDDESDESGAESDESGAESDETGAQSDEPNGADGSDISEISAEVSSADESKRKKASPKRRARREDGTSTRPRGVNEARRDDRAGDTYDADVLGLEFSLSRVDLHSDGDADDESPPHGCAILQ